ncbi:hypothetical protein [Zhongshania aliphaticivorans]|uniref:hypothetical protein n=1 Tax=Zhongshania aliphaticivorans TaxID=1470434 RepID=UPI0039C9E775
MNLNTLNSVVVNGSRSLFSILGGATVAASAQITATANFIESGSSEVDATALIIPQPLHTHHGAAQVLGQAVIRVISGSLLTASSEVRASATVIALIVRVIPVSIGFQGTAATTSIVAAGIGFSEVNATAAIVPNATKITSAYTVVAATATVTLGDVGFVVRNARTLISTDSGAEVRVEATVNNLLDGFAYITAPASILLPDSGITRFVFPSITLVGYSEGTAVGTKAHAIESSVLGSAEILAYAFNSGQFEVDGPITCTAAIEAIAIRVVTPVLEVGSNALAVIEFGPQQRFLAYAQVAAPASIIANISHIFHGQAPSSLGSGLLTAAATRIHIAASSTSGTADSTSAPTRTVNFYIADITSEGTAAVAADITYMHITAEATCGGSAGIEAAGAYIQSGFPDDITCSAEVVPTGTRITHCMLDLRYYGFGILEWTPYWAYAYVTANATRVLAPVFVGVPAVAELVPVGTHIHDGITETVAANCGIYAFPSTNPASRDKPAFTFVRPPYLSYFVRPPYTSILSRTSSPDTFRRAA